MGETLQKYSNVLIIGGVILLLGLAGMVMFRGGSTPGSTASLNDATNQQIALGQQIERELLNELLQLRDIRLDNTIFSDPAFTSLVDFSRPIAAQPIGRENPFAPIENVPGVTPRGTAPTGSQTEQATTTPPAAPEQ